MWVAYCKEELPTKKVVGWSNKQATAKGLKCSGHDVALNPDDESFDEEWNASCGEFELTDSEWDAVFVDGDSSTTVANIVSNHGDKFVA